MRILPLLILNLLTVLQDRPQVQPHGPDFKISCGTCHSSKGWHLDKEIYSFNHSSTAFPLTGEHTGADCRQCHPTLIFRDAKTQCSDCHNDVHQSTVGLECSRCHTTKSWLVENINEIHRMSRFPLEGAHRTAICSDCHKSESLVRFDAPGVNCIDCHRQDYQSAEEPNHVKAGFPEDCSMCHQVNSVQWTESEFTHNVFPLEQGHSTAKCADCHTTRNYSDAGRECYQCHQKDYVESKSPDHNVSRLPTNCENCHTLVSGWKPTLFDHNTFPLTFGHSKPACIECHVGGSYSNTNPDCLSCHKPDFTDSKNPNHQAAGFSNVCMTCHTTNPGWIPTTFSHGKFPLELAHSIPDCIDCHIGDNYSTLTSDCYTCHNKDYTSAVNPNHSIAGFPRDCATCHTVNPGWKPANFNHNSFPLTQGHSTPLCIECHKDGNYTSVPKECNSCHLEDYLSSANPKHSAAGFSQDCLSCHSTDPGWKPTSFIHNMFPLTSGHSTPACSDCHTGVNYASTTSDCYSCHKQDYTSTANPNHSEAMFPKECQTCHTTNPGWKPSTFTHSSFPLTLGHSTAACIECHKGGIYTSTSADCYTCHQADFFASANPNHISAAFSQVCQNCHSVNPGWKPTTFGHNNFPLTLGHATPSCIVCHTGEKYAGTSSECYLCHQLDYTISSNPKHSAAGFPTLCLTCHTTNPGWKPATFNHSSFPLTGGHSIPGCNNCHIGDNFTSLPTDCYACHQHDFLATTNPNHGDAMFPQTCQTCHSANPGWKPTTFTHGAFPLTLGHASASCNDCHIGGNYTTTPTNCYSCHQTDFTTSSNPNHTAAGFSQACQTCHTTNPGWHPATFNHSIFPLTYGHSGPTCIDCHKGENYTTTPTDCYGCHQPDYTAAADPNHVISAFPQVCQTCHSTNPGWRPTTYNHSSFPLTQGHSTPQCADCHIGGNYTTTPANCYSCHQNDFTTSTNPSHTAAGFSQVCQTCHTTNPGWAPTTFNHTGFSLTLGHSTPQCIDCHKGENYTTTPTDCYSCHQTDYVATTMPGHVAAGFPHECQVCHTTIPGWKPATYDHTSFPLTLGHSTPGCTDCHIGGNYTSIPTDCYACHQNDYTTSSNPNHQTLGFSTVCTQCHTTNPDWKPAKFAQHDTQFFPIYSGKHLGQWDACTDCHTNTSDYKIFSCILCHEHSSAAETNSHHSGVLLYVYNATSCYDCHRNGRAK